MHLSLREARPVAWQKPAKASFAKGTVGNKGLTMTILLSGRAASSPEALRFPSLTALLVSASDGIVNVEPAAEKVGRE